MSFYSFSQSPPDSNPTSLGTSFPGLSTIFAMFSTFPALQDWTKILVVGSLFPLLHLLWGQVYQYFLGLFFLTARFREHDESFEWVLSLMSKLPEWSSMRDFEVSTWSWSKTRTAITLEEDETENHKAARKLSYLPSVSQAYNFKYHGCWVQIRRVQSPTGWTTEQSLVVSVLTRDPNFIMKLLKDARREFTLAQDDRMGIYISNNDNIWECLGSRDKRSMKSIVLDHGIGEELLRDAKNFLSSKLWYMHRGVPYRRGYLLYGPPGSGKTSLIHALAGALNLNVYVISLSRVGLDDNSLTQLINSLPESCIALMEDIDAAFTHGVNRDNLPKAETPPGGPTPSDTNPSSISKITLSGLLNALDGVGAKEGRILFATTNRYESLDSALTRPGRMDLHIEFQNASQRQANELFLEFYLPDQRDAQIQADRIADDGDDASDKGSVDSGYSSLPRDIIEEADTLIEKVVPSSGPGAFTGTIHTQSAHILRKGMLEELARRFADTIPQRVCSMASLQGYLMMHKSDPVSAVANVRLWVEKQKKPDNSDIESSNVKNAAGESLLRLEDIKNLLSVYSPWS